MRTASAIPAPAGTGRHRLRDPAPLPTCPARPECRRRGERLLLRTLPAVRPVDALVRDRAARQAADAVAGPNPYPWGLLVGWVAGLIVAFVLIVGALSGRTPSVLSTPNPVPVSTSVACQEGDSNRVCGPGEAKA